MINPYDIKHEIYNRQGEATPKKSFSKDKLATRLKHSMIAIDSATMPNEVFLYSVGYNAAVSTLLIGIANGEFDA